MRVDAGAPPHPHPPAAAATSGPFSAAVNSHAASFPLRPTGNDDGEAPAGRATFAEK